MAYKKQVEAKYAGKLSEFGDAKLDEMAQAVRERTVKPKEPVKSTCRSCGHYRVLRRGYCALLCEECHAGIVAAAARKPGFCYDAS